VTVNVDGDLTQTDDGYVIYYQTGKDESKIKDGKYTAISSHGYGDSTSPQYNFDKYLGKATYVSFSLDGTKATATGVALKAQPKLKVKYSATDGFTYSVNGGQFSKLVTSAAINDGNTEYVVGGDNKNYIIDGDEDVDWYLNFGGTKYFWAIEYNSTDGVAVSSKEAKVKISAQAKAPKASLKLDAAKAFTWKISNKQEYQIKVGNNEATAWATGSNNADDWSKIFATAKVTEADAKVVSGDAITSDVKIYLRTKAGTKAASAINVISLKKSAASPTGAAVTVKGLKQSGKTASGASITAGDTDIQYSTDGKTWKTLKKTKSVSFTKDTEKNVLVRIAGVSKNATVLPSLNTSIDIDHATGVATVTTFDYDSNGDVKSTTDTKKPE
jgi:hypothetical protein